MAPFLGPVDQHQPDRNQRHGGGKGGVNGSPSTRWPAATPNNGVRKVKAESRLAEYRAISANQITNVTLTTQTVW